MREAIGKPSPGMDFGERLGRWTARPRSGSCIRCLSRRTEKGRAYGVVTAKALAVLEALLWGFHNARSGLAVICRNRKTKTARIAIRAVSFAGGVGLEPKTHKVHCASQARARARYLADVTRRNIIWGSACGVSRWGSACGVSRLLRLAPSLWCSDENAPEAIFSDGCAAYILRSATD